jgi:hypothetical protein
MKKENILYTLALLKSQMIRYATPEAITIFAEKHPNITVHTGATELKSDAELSDEFDTIVEFMKTECKP